MCPGCNRLAPALVTRVHAAKKAPRLLLLLFSTHGVTIVQAGPAGVSLPSWHLAPVHTRRPGPVMCQRSHVSLASSQELQDVAYHHWDYLTLTSAGEARMLRLGVQKPDLRTPGPSMYSFCLTTPAPAAVPFLSSEVESVEALCRANPAHAPRLRTKQSMQSVAGSIRTAKKCEWRSSCREWWPNKLIMCAAILGRCVCSVRVSPTCRTNRRGAQGRGTSRS